MCDRVLMNDKIITTVGDFSSALNCRPNDLVWRHDDDFRCVLDENISTSCLCSCDILSSLKDAGFVGVYDPHKDAIVVSKAKGRVAVRARRDRYHFSQDAVN